MPVTRFEVMLRRPLAEGRAFGGAGRYEELAGRLHLAIDPRHAANRAITDVELAPRDAVGRVAFAADVSILLPVDRARTSGRLLVDVVNRGNTVAVPNFNHATRPAFAPGGDPHPPIDVGDGWLMRRGWVVVSCGWQCDLPPGIPGLLRLEAPEALGPDGRRLTGRVYVQLQAPVDVADFMLSDRCHDPYVAADLGERDAVLVVRDQPDGPAEVIPRSRWRFARIEGERVIPDGRHIYLDGGFAKGRIYQIAYTAVGARVLGLGMAALRDCVAWLKHGSAAEGNPAPGALRHAYAYGRSQTGRLLRTMVHHDVNADEAGRRALDGIIANVAGAMLGEFNDRFGQNSKDRPDMMDHFVPFQVEPRGGLKVFYTNTSFEYHRGDASLIHTDPAGDRDVEHGPDVRVYHFAGTAYGTRVSAVDGDGNERAGIAVPELRVPLATHTGWNLRHPDSGGPDQLLYFAGATLPFARTRAEREAAGDPRPAIAERYRSREDYLARVGAAARALAALRYLLDEDVETSLAFAARMWDAWASKA